MNFQLTTIAAVTITLPEDEARSILVDPTTFQEQLRTALSAQVAEEERLGERPGKGWRKNPLRLSGDTRPLPQGSIARAARKQNKRQKDFLAQRSGRRPKPEAARLPCRVCEKPIKNTKMGWGTHYRKAHPAFEVPPVQTADDESVA